MIKVVIKGNLVRIEWGKKYFWEIRMRGFF